MTVLLNAQWRGMRATELGAEQGIGTPINDIVKDDRGFVYLGGSQGLMKYDGSTIELFSHDPDDPKTIASGEVYSLLLGNDGLIWICHRYGGLCSFDPKNYAFNRYPVPELPYAYTPTAHGLLEDPEGKLWVGGHHFQLLYFDRSTNTFESYAPDWIDPEQYGRRFAISTILQDVDQPDILWLAVVDYQNPDAPAGGYGVVAFNKRSKTFNAHPNGGRIIYQDSTGTLYGTSVIQGVSKYRPPSTTHEYSPLSGIQQGFMPRAILPINGQFWVLSAYGLQSWDGRQEFHPVYSIDRRSGMIFDNLSKDDDGNIWICQSRGVTVINPDDQHIRFYSLDQFDANPRIYPGRLAYDPGRDILYLANSAQPNIGRLYRIPLNASNNAAPDFIQLSYDIQGLAFDDQGQLWISGGGHLSRLQNGRPVKATGNDLPGQRIPWLWNLRTSRDGWIAGVGDNQFIWFHPQRGAFKTISARTITEALGPDVFDGHFLGFKFGSQENAYCISNVIHEINLVDGSFRKLKTPAGFNPNDQEITDIEEDLEGYIWASSAAYTGKFAQLEDSLTLIEKYTVGSGLPSVLIHEMHCDPAGRMWMFSDNGMACLNTSTDEVRKFDVRHGLPEIYIDPRQVLTLPDERIVTVNSNGIIVFHPDSLWNSQSPRSVPVAIKDIRVDGIVLRDSVAVNYLQEIELPFGSNVIDVAFQGLAYPTADDLRYSYRLGNQEQWIDIGSNRLVTLPALSPGQYEFQVKAGTPDGNAPVRSLTLNVPTPFYQQWWFRLIALAALLGLSYAMYAYRVRKIRREEEEKTAINKQIAELELKALRSQMNPHFMFNSLNSIKDFILQSKPAQAAEYLSDFAHLVRLILQNSREKTISLQEELDTLMLYIGLEELRFDHAFTFNCVIEEGIQLDQVQIPPMLLQPYIENAIWHGLMHKKEDGHLTLRFASQNGHVQCVVDDDGVGRERARALKSMSATRYKSMGMGITHDRIEILNKLDSLGIVVKVEDKIDPDGNSRGTRVILTIPKPVQ